MPMSTPDPWLKRLLLDPVDLAARVRRCVCAARARWTAAKDRAVLVAFYHATYGSDWTTSTLGQLASLEALHLSDNHLRGPASAGVRTLDPPQSLGPELQRVDRPGPFGVVEETSLR